MTKQDSAPKSQNIVWHQHHITKEDREKRFGQKGVILWFTGLSGSGPAYVYVVMEALIEGGKKNGLPVALAKKLALQTVYGSAKAALMSGIEPGGLREMVTSPGGTTMEGLAVLKDRKVFDAFCFQKKEKFLDRWRLCNLAEKV